MPIIQSAKKRVRRAQAQAVANSKTKRAMRSAIKAFYADVEAKKDSTKSQSKAYSAIDIAQKKNVINKNRAARVKSQLNQVSKQAKTTKVGTKVKKSAPTKKTTAKTTKPKATTKSKTTKKTTSTKSKAKK